MFSFKIQQAAKIPENLNNRLCLFNIIFPNVFRKGQNENGLMFQVISKGMI